MKPQEVIIVNNNSKTFLSSKKIINFRKDLTIKIINCVKNFGSADGRNIGSSLSNSNFLAFLDDDDTWDKDYLKLANEVYKKEKKLVTVSDIYNSHSKKILKSVKNFSDIKISDSLIRNPGFIGSNVIINKNLLMTIKGWDADFVPAEDRSLLIKLLLTKIKISNSRGKVFYLYKKSRKNLSNNSHSIIKGHSNLLNKYKKNFNFSQKNFIKFKINLNKYKITYGIQKLLYLLICIFYFILFKIFNG
jgi:glycosyltransferase involved in cell wall biosynthesis